MKGMPDDCSFVGYNERADYFSPLVLEFFAHNTLSKFNVLYVGFSLAFPASDHETQLHAQEFFDDIYSF